MRIFLFLLLVLPGSLCAQVDLDLQQCRSMALQNSKEVAIAGRQQEKAVFETRSFRADFLPKLSVVGFGLYNQRNMIIK